jgi:hypothetical protein
MKDFQAKVKKLLNLNDEIKNPEISLTLHASSYTTAYLFTFVESNSKFHPPAGGPNKSKIKNPKKNR